MGNVLQVHHRDERNLLGEHSAKDNDEDNDPSGRRLCVQLVREVWSRVTTDLLTVGYAFYAKVFTTYPTWRLTLFVGVDMREQPQLLMEMMNYAVESFLSGAGRLTSPDIVNVLQSLGERHAGYGVEEADYSKLGACFLDTLEYRFAPEGCFGPAHRSAFTVLYGCVVQHMMTGHHSVRGSFLAIRWAERLVQVDACRLENGWNAITRKLGITKRDLTHVLEAACLTAPIGTLTMLGSKQERDAEYAAFVDIIELVHVCQGEEMESRIANILSQMKCLREGAAPQEKSEGQYRVKIFCSATVAFLSSCMQDDLALIDTWHRKFEWIASTYCG